VGALQRVVIGGGGVSSDLRREREDAFRADVARLIQVMRHHLPAHHASPEIASLREPVRHLAGLLDADVPSAHLQDAATVVVEAHDWPGPDAIDSDESPVISVSSRGDQRGAERWTAPMITPGERMWTPH
jgi:hypothetical protein